MRIVKDAEERRNEILDTAEELFMVHGYEQSSVQGIIDKIGIAKGTFYYYFKSKEELLNGIVDRYNQIIVNRAMLIAKNKKMGCLQRFQRIIQSMQISGEVNPEVMEQLHTQQNALLHQKVLGSMINNLTPILTEITIEGNADGSFHCRFPRESVEMLLTYGLTAFDSDIIDFPEEQKNEKMSAMYAIAALLLGVDEWNEQ